jgi:hypothetical protein
LRSFICIKTCLVKKFENMYIRCFTIFLMICCSLPATVFAQFTGTAPYCHERGGLILNEISNMGASGQDEYFELIVMPDPNNPTANINISGWIIDDNNYPGSGVGTATGYLAFGDCYTNISSLRQHQPQCCPSGRRPHRQQFRQCLYYTR